MARLMLIEPEAAGHRMQYVRRIIRAARQQSCSIQLATRQTSLAHPAYQTLQDEFGDAVETWILRETEADRRLMISDSPARKQWGYYRLFRRFYRDLPKKDCPDVLFVPYLDHCDKWVALLGSPFGNTPWGGVVMGYRFHQSPMGAITPPSRRDNLERMMFARLLSRKRLRALVTIDELLRDYTREYLPDCASLLYYVGDPFDLKGCGSRQEARARLQLHEEDKLLLVFGSLTSRKGLDAVLAASQAACFPTRVKVLVAGMQLRDTPALMAGPAASSLRAQGRLIEQNRYLSDEEEYYAFRAADLVWAGYRDFYQMSAVIIQAAAMGLPVLACREGLVGHMTRKYCLGLDVDLQDAHSVATAIQRLADDEDLAVRCGNNGLKLAANHTGEQFGQAIYHALTRK